jgi:hypothetical protein
MDPLQLQLTRQSGKIPRAIVADNSEPRRGGRRRVDEEEELRDRGEELHRQLTG